MILQGRRLEHGLNMPEVKVEGAKTIGPKQPVNIRWPLLGHL